MRALALLVLVTACGSTSTQQPTTITNAANTTATDTCCCLIPAPRSELMAPNVCTSRYGKCDVDITECAELGPVPDNPPPASAAPVVEDDCCCIFTDAAQELTPTQCVDKTGTCDSEMTECYFVGPTP
jgi:hypothetical protein